MARGELAQVRSQFEQSGKAERVYRDFVYKTRKSWTRQRRVIGKAESTTSKQLLVRRSLPPEDLASIPPKEFLAPLGAALRLIRDRRNLKQYQAAKMAGMTKAMLSSYETGKALPSLLSLAAILVALNSDFRELQEALYSSAQPDSPLRQEAAPDEPASITEESSLPLSIAVGRLEAQLSRAADALELLAGGRKQITSRPSKLRESERPSTARP